MTLTWTFSSTGLPNAQGESLLSDAHWRTHKCRYVSFWIHAGNQRGRWTQLHLHQKHNSNEESSLNPHHDIKGFQRPGHQEMIKFLIHLGWGNDFSTCGPRHNIWLQVFRQTIRHFFMTCSCMSTCSFFCTLISHYSLDMGYCIFSHTFISCTCSRIVLGSTWQSVRHVIHLLLDESSLLKPHARPLV